MDKIRLNKAARLRLNKSQSENKENEYSSSNCLNYKHSNAAKDVRSALCDIGGTNVNVTERRKKVTFNETCEYFQESVMELPNTCRANLPEASTKSSCNKNSTKNIQKKRLSNMQANC